MKNSCFVVIICLLLLQGNVAEEVTLLEQCNGYCFSVLQPLLDHLLKYQEAADAKNISKDKIHSLELTISNLQSQLLNSGTEIKNKEEHINDLREQILGKDEQMNGKDEQIKDLRKQIQVKDEQMNGKDEQIKDLRKQIQGKEEQMNGKDEQIKDLRKASGWTVIQRRIDGSVDFNRKWEAYKEGFGAMRGEFFIGLEKLHLMTAAQPQELYIELRDVNGTYRHARYDNFSVGSEEENFILKSLGKYSGNAGDSLRIHEGGMFATLDRDIGNCVLHYGGPWWFKREDCGRSSLNGKFFEDGIAHNENGISWGLWSHPVDYKISLTFVKITIRPKRPQT